MGVLIPYLVNAGVAGTVLAAFALGYIYPRSVVTGKDEEIRELKQTVALERQRADASVAAATVTRDVLMAFRGGGHEALAQAREARQRDQ